MENIVVKREKRNGFTLVELIIVIAIIAILAAIAIPKFGDMRTTANKKSDIATAKNVAAIISSKIASGELKYYREFTNLHRIDKVPSLTTDEWDNKSAIDITPYLDGEKDASGKIVPKTKGVGSYFLMTFIDGTVKIYTGNSEVLNTNNNLIEVYPEQTGVYAD